MPARYRRGEASQVERAEAGLAAQPRWPACQTGRVESTLTDAGVDEQSVASVAICACHGPLEQTGTTRFDRSRPGRRRRACCPPVHDDRHRDGSRESFGPSSRIESVPDEPLRSSRPRPHSRPTSGLRATRRCTAEAVQRESRRPVEAPELVASPCPRRPVRRWKLDVPAQTSASTAPSSGLPVHAQASRSRRSSPFRLAKISGGAPPGATTTCFSERFQKSCVSVSVRPAATCRSVTSPSRASIDPVRVAGR